MAECKKILADRMPCGLTSGGLYCPFHGADFIAPENDYILGLYISSKNRPYLDLSGVHFKRFRIDGHWNGITKDTMFNEAIFTDCEFNRVKFPGDLNFRECTFENSVFHLCKTDPDKTESIDFSFATFRGARHPFIGCLWRAGRKIDFGGAHFETALMPFSWGLLSAPEVTFLSCDIESRRFYVTVTPANPLISHGRLFIETQKVDFGGLKVAGNFEMSYIAAKDKPTTSIDFGSVNMSQMQTATFVNANFENTTFVYTLFGDARFINPNWPSDGKRRRLRDDSRGAEPGILRQLLNTYIQLKRNYEQANNFIDAGDWFYREMECRRRLAKAHRVKHPWLGLPAIILYQLYKFVSEYGENYVRPLWGLVITLVFGATSYFYSGFGRQSTNYDFAWPPTVDSFLGFIDALAFSGGIMLFQSVKLALEQPFPTPQLAIVQVLFTLALVPLFLLALRRKFRR